jgi:hypothetical protein
MAGPSTSTSNLATKSVIVSMSNVIEGGGRKVIMSPGPAPSYPSLDYNTRPDISGTPFSSLDLAEANNLGTNIIVKTQPVSPFDNNRVSLTQNQMQNVIVYPNKTRPHPQQQQLHHHYSSNNLQGYDIPSPEVSSHGQGQQLGQPPLNNDYSSQSLQLGHYDGSDPGGIFPHHTQFISPHISSETSEVMDRKPNIANIQHGVQYSGFYSAPPSDTSSYSQHWPDNQHPSQGYQQHRLQDSDEQQTQQPSPSQQSIESSSNLIGYPNQNQPTVQQQQQQQQSNNETFQDPGGMNNGSVFLYRDLSQFDFSYL